jgi:hypothetical protein
MNQFARISIWIFCLFALSSLLPNLQVDWAIEFLIAAGISFAMFKRWYFLPIYMAASLYFFYMTVYAFPSFLKFRYWFAPDPGKGAFHNLLPVSQELGDAFSYLFCFVTSSMYMFHVNYRRVQEQNMKRNSR